MSISDLVLDISNIKEELRTALNLPKSVPFRQYKNNLPTGAGTLPSNTDSYADFMIGLYLYKGVRCGFYDLFTYKEVGNPTNNTTPDIHSNRGIYLSNTGAVNYIANSTQTTIASSQNSNIIIGAYSGNRNARDPGGLAVITSVEPDIANSPSYFTVEHTFTAPAGDYTISYMPDQEYLKLSISDNNDIKRYGESVSVYVGETGSEIIVSTFKKLNDGVSTLVLDTRSDTSYYMNQYNAGSKNYPVVMHGWMINSGLTVGPYAETTTGPVIVLPSELRLIDKSAVSQTSSRTGTLGVSIVGGDIKHRNEGILKSINIKY